MDAAIGEKRYRFERRLFNGSHKSLSQPTALNFVVFDAFLLEVGKTRS